MLEGQKQWEESGAGVERLLLGKAVSSCDHPILLQMLPVLAWSVHVGSSLVSGPAEPGLLVQIVVEPGLCDQFLSVLPGKEVSPWRS